MFDKLKNWWLFAVICLVVLPPMEASDWQLVSGLSHTLLAATLVLGALALIAALVAAVWETRTLKILAVAFVATFVFAHGWAVLFHYQPQSGATAPPTSTHMAYSSHQTLSTAVEDYNNFLNLDNVAGLYLSAPHGREEVTLIWPTSPSIATEHPKTEPRITVQGLRMLAGPMKRITFDSAHPVCLIGVGDRIFQVQLISIDDKTTEERPLIEYSFAISEVEPTSENKANAITQSPASPRPSAGP